MASCGSDMAPLRQALLSGLFINAAVLLPDSELSLDPLPAVPASRFAMMSIPISVHISLTETAPAECAAASVK